MEESTATERFQAVVLSSFGAAALLIAVLGIYRVLAYSVSLRSREFGIRVALGSNRMKLAWLLLSDVSLPLLGGMATGLVAAGVAAKWFHSILYETSTMDPWATALSIFVLLLGALLASLGPLRTATSVDPVIALKAE